MRGGPSCGMVRSGAVRRAGAGPAPSGATPRQPDGLPKRAVSIPEARTAMDGPPTDAPLRAKRSYDAERTRRTILEAARAVFAEKGCSGANVGEIVTRAATTKPMVYYHFGSKRHLFAAVLEEVYGAMREIEAGLQLAGMPPEAGLRRLVEATFDDHADHPDWIRLIAIANIHGAEHLQGSVSVAARNTPVLAIPAELLERGRGAGLFRGGLDPLHLHLLMASMSFYRVSNRHTWGVIFGRDRAADAPRQRDLLVEAVLRLVRSDAAAP